MSQPYPVRDVLLQKVTVFITRDAASGRELLLFRRPEDADFIQIPAGTVELLELPADAAVREAVEETGLSPLSRPLSLGVRPVSVGEDEAYLTADSLLLLAPIEASTIVRGAVLRRGVRVRQLAQQEGFARVAYEEHSTQDGELVITNRQSGWVPLHHLTRQVERHFFHIHTTLETPSHWRVQAEPDHIFECYWAPLRAGLTVAPLQQEWLETFYSRLS